MHGFIHLEGCVQCFLLSRNMGYVAPTNIYFHYLKKHFLDQSIKKNILFNFEKGRTGCVLLQSAWVKTFSALGLRHKHSQVIRFFGRWGVCLDAIYVFWKACVCFLTISETPRCFETRAPRIMKNVYGINVSQKCWMQFWKQNWWCAVGHLIIGSLWARTSVHRGTQSSRRSACGANEILK